jgi:hypothetical protein
VEQAVIVAEVLRQEEQAPQDKDITVAKEEDNITPVVVAVPVG